MKEYLIFTSLLIALSVGVPAYASDDDCYVPMSKWQSRDAVRSMAKTHGWKVRRIKIDDGCYEIKGRDSQGRKIEVKVDPATLAIIEFEYEDDHDKHKRKKKRGKNPPPSQINPPDNGLFAPNSKPKVVVK